MPETPEAREAVRKVAEEAFLAMPGRDLFGEPWSSLSASLREDMEAIAAWHLSSLAAARAEERERIAAAFDAEAATWRRRIKANPCVKCKDPGAEPFGADAAAWGDDARPFTAEERRDALHCVVNENRVEWYEREAAALRARPRDGGGSAT